MIRRTQNRFLTLYLRLLVVSVFLCLGTYAVFSTAIGQAGQTYYLSPTGNNNNAGTSAAAAWATFNRAWQVMKAGDTLILLDGVYNQAIQPNISGQAGRPITIRAQNDGKAVIDGQKVRIPISITPNYFMVEGVVARNGSDDAVIITRGQYNIFRRISGYDADTNGNASVFSIQGAHNLVEDCIAAGTGRKMMIVFISHYNTVRRCFINWQQWDGRNFSDAWPWGDGLDLYGSNYNIVENVISYGSNPTHHIGIVSQALTADDAVVGNKILGTIAINAGMTADGQPVVWGNTRPQPTQYTAMRDFNWPGQRSGFNIYEGQAVRDTLLQDILGWGNAGLGISWIDNGPYTTSNNRINRATMLNNGLDNPPNWGGIGIDAIKQDLNQFIAVENSRIETVYGGSPMNGEGARLIHRYVDGILMDGSNGQPAQSLWPWPMEDRIQAELGISVNNLVESITGIDTNPNGTPTAVPTGTASPTSSPTSSTTPSPTSSATGTPSATSVPTGTPDPIVSASRRVNLPYLGNWPPQQSTYTPAIFWLGKVDTTANYADVRTAYYADHLEIFVHIIDRFLWFDNSPAPADMTKWDAVSIYLNLAGAIGQAPTNTSYRFVKQLGNGGASQALYQGTGTDWSLINGQFTTESFWRGVSPNDLSDDRGWTATLRIPYSTLGLSGAPASGTIWGVAAAVHDRDDSAGTSIPDQVWPEAMDPLQPSKWGQLHFGVPAYAAQSTQSGTTKIRQGLDGATVVDAAVGGHGDCGGGKDDWAVWGNANYAGYDQFNIQNQWDVADFSCFSKYYVTFPLNSLPSGKSIVSAKVTLNLFGNAGYNPGDAKPSAIQVMTVAEDWDEGSISWNNAPFAFENISVSWVNPIDDAHPAGAYTWDVSRAVERAYRLGQPLRLVFYSTDGDYDSGKYFWASNVDDWNEAGRPTLDIAWGEASSGPVPTPTPTTTPNPTATPTPTTTPNPTATPTPDLGIIFADGFEGGNLAQWSKRSTDGGDLQVSRTAALVADRGMLVVIDDNTSLSVTDERPASEKRYRARFYFDPNSIPMSSSASHVLFFGYSGKDLRRPVLRLELRYLNGRYEVRVAFLDNGTTWRTSLWRPLSDASHYLEVDWRAATVQGARNGQLDFWVDGVIQASLTGLDNDSRRIDRVRLGAVAGIDSATRGTYYLDAFESRRELAIGAATNASVGGQADEEDLADLTAFVDINEDDPEEAALMQEVLEQAEQDENAAGHSFMPFVIR